MRIILTNHARLRASQRWISFEEIIDTIENPDEIRQQDDEVFCFKKLWNENILLVYAKDDTWNWVIITVLRTSKVKKYWIW